MRRRADWNTTRSTHARVLESLQAVIARHPSTGGSTTLPEPEAVLADVVDLRPRLAAALASRPNGDDAA